MSVGFSNSFWSGDYAGGARPPVLSAASPAVLTVSKGLGVLFGKLQQGVQENEQVLTVARLRAEAEEAYANKLAEIAPQSERIQGGFSRDDGASVRKVSPALLSPHEPRR